MTHKDLLAKIEIRIADFCDDEKDFCDVCSSWKALRAVVELHRPMEYGSCYGCDDRCGCYEGDLGDYNKWETCPTIQAIEKELQ